MITRNQLDQVILSLPKDLSADEWRTAASVMTGVYYEKTLAELIKFYSLNKNLAFIWWQKLGFGDDKNEIVAPKKNKPKKLLSEYINSNVGTSVSAQDLADVCKVSLPTVYTFINANRSWFKKLSRGLYEIVDADKEREKVKK